jgi:hypothetical protein
MSRVWLLLLCLGMPGVLFFSGVLVELGFVQLLDCKSRFYFIGVDLCDSYKKSFSEDLLYDRQVKLSEFSWGQALIQEVEARALGMSIKRGELALSLEELDIREERPVLEALYPGVDGLIYCADSETGVLLGQATVIVDWYGIIHLRLLNSAGELAYSLDVTLLQCPAMVDTCLKLPAFVQAKKPQVVLVMDKALSMRSPWEADRGVLLRDLLSLGFSLSLGGLGIFLAPRRLGLVLSLFWIHEGAWLLWPLLMQRGRSPVGALEVALELVPGILQAPFAAVLALGLLHWFKRVGVRVGIECLFSLALGYGIWISIVQIIY